MSFGRMNGMEGSRVSTFSEGKESVGVISNGVVMLPTVYVRLVRLYAIEEKRNAELRFPRRLKE